MARRRPQMGYLTWRAQHPFLPPDPGYVLSRRTGRGLPSIPGSWVTPEPGTVVIASPNTQVAVLLDDDAPSITRGYPRFRELERPTTPGGELRRTLTAPDTLDPFEMTLPILFDGLRQRRSVEDHIERLELMAAPRTGKPQPVHVHGPVPHSRLTWWLANIDWGDALYHNDERVRQHAVLTLLERVRGELAIDVGVGSRGGKVKPRKGEDTFHELARRLRRTRNMEVTAKEIARANAMSVGAKLKPSMELRLPR